MATTIGMIESVHDAAEIARRPLQAEQCALVVIDIQEKLLPPIFEKERLLRNAQLLLRLAKIVNLPVLAAQQYTKGWERSFRRSLPCCRMAPASRRWSSTASAATSSLRR